MTGTRNAPSAPVPVSRAQVLAHRVAAQGLDRRPDAAAPDHLAPGGPSGGPPADERGHGDDPPRRRDAAAGDLPADHGAAALAVLGLGVQDSPAGTAPLSLAARLAAGADPDPDQLGDPERWIVTWAIRGAPHLLRAGDVRAMALATWPADADDAAGRLAGFGVALRKRGGDALAALRTTAEAARAVVTGPMTKGEVSAAVTQEVPEHAEWCRRCGATHISDPLLRLAVLPAGLRIVPGATPVTFTPVSDWPGVPTHEEGAGAVVDAYLGLHGPATPKEVAAYLQTGQGAVKAAWPDGLAEVRVDGRRTWLPEDRLDALRDAPPPSLVRLLPRSDPWLLARDRALIVPDKARRKVLWPTLGFPGGVLVDGEVAGTWRTKVSGRRLDVTVQPFAPLPTRAWPAIEDEAARVAALRGNTDVRILDADG